MGSIKGSYLVTMGGMVQEIIQAIAFVGKGVTFDTEITH